MSSSLVDVKSSTHHATNSCVEIYVMHVPLNLTNYLSFFSLKQLCLPFLLFIFNIFLLIYNILLMN